MAKVYVTEYADIRGNAPYEPAIALQTVAIAATNTQSSAFNANSNWVRVHTDAICSIAFGLSPVATANYTRLAANQTEYFYVIPGHKIGVITNT